MSEIPGDGLAPDPEAQAHGWRPAALTPGILRLLDDVEQRLAGNPERAARVRTYVTSLIRDATLRHLDGRTFVLTGDIPAMWLRDSTWQYRPLLAAAPGDPETLELIAGLCRHQAACVLADPYANAFTLHPGIASQHHDFAQQHPLVWERKYELDSLAAVLDLAARLWRVTGFTGHLDLTFRQAARRIVEVITAEQHHDRDSYRLHRPHAPARDSLSHDGRGAPCAPVGLSWSGFRPSDDACQLPYLIPANAAAVVGLRGLADVAGQVWRDQALSVRARRLAEEIDRAITEYGLVTGPLDEPIWAYEVDGRGAQLLTDDANIPSLLSLPYLGYCSPSQPRYLATRRFLLSSAHPGYIVGSRARGLGSPHTPEGYVWPLAIAMAALTQQDAATTQAALACLEDTDAGTGRLHESFDANDPAKFTRAWFSWPEMTYVHLVLHSLATDASTHY
ncbi:MAG: glycoside hydrolase family 125 protein [Arachnia sp.]